MQWFASRTPQANRSPAVSAPKCSGPLLASGEAMIISRAQRADAVRIAEGFGGLADDFQRASLVVAPLDSPVGSLGVTAVVRRADQEALGRADLESNTLTGTK